MAGDLALGADVRRDGQPMVWQAVERDGFVPETQSMRRRVLEHIPAREADRQLKLGSGGLRDVEFAVQLLQLVHGRTDERLRAPTTLSAIAALTRGGYVGREDGEALHESYAFLRTLEHRIQLHQLRRTHVVPADEESLRRLGRSMGFVKEPAASLDKAWQHHRREVRRLHEKLFYRPLLEAVARIPETDVRLSSEAAGDRLAALGYADPAAALRNLEALTSGVTRTANIQKALLPAMLQWFAECADPDAGLFGFRRISEALGRTPWYLKTLRDEGQVAERLARVLATSRYATTLLETEPQGVQILAGDLSPQPAEALTEEMLASSGRQEDVEKAVRAIRAVRRRELFRLAAGEVLGLTDVADVGAGLSRLTDATLEATLVSVSQGRAGAARARRAADPAGDRGDGSLRRLRALLRQRRRRDVRAPAEPGRRPARRVVVRPGGGQRDPAPPVPAGRRPAAGGRRRPAPGGQAGAAGAHPRLLRRLLREVVEGLGVPGAAAGRRRGRRPGAARPGSTS